MKSLGRWRNRVLRGGGGLHGKRAQSSCCLLLLPLCLCALLSLLVAKAQEATECSVHYALLARRDRNNLSGMTVWGERAGLPQCKTSRTFAGSVIALIIVIIIVIIILALEPTPAPVLTYGRDLQLAAADRLCALSRCLIIGRHQTHKAPSKSLSRFVSSSSSSAPASSQALRPENLIVADGGSGTRACLPACPHSSSIAKLNSACNFCFAVLCVVRLESSLPLPSRP